MKIDLHCHTKKTKEGEAITRNVTCGKFISELENSQVSIVAITNHNHFDYRQYKEFKNKGLEKKIQVWPGIEFDVKGETSEGHCIVISNPSYEKEFDTRCQSIIGEQSCDDFKISIYDMVSCFEEMDVTVIAHYGWKKPSLNQKDLDIMTSQLGNEKTLFLEVPQLRSAGILYAHNLTSFIGSDIQDWDKYSECCLPDLKMPIKDYDHFNLLVKKDPEILDTFINQKINEKIYIEPFEDCKIEIPIYNDINIFFGGKGTGKSTFLSKIKNHFDSYGNADVSYYDGQTKETEYNKMVKITNELEDFEFLNINDSEEEFIKINEWKDVSVTPITKYIDWYNTKDVNKLSEQFGFRNAVFNETVSENSYQDYIDDYKELLSLKSKIDDVNHIDEYLNKSDLLTLNVLLNKMVKKSKNIALTKWIEYRSVLLEKTTIDKMKILCQTKSGVSQLPSSTGLLDTYLNCKNLYDLSFSIVKEINTPFKTKKRVIGELQEKGSIYLEKDIYINPNESTDLILKKSASFNITDLRDSIDYLQKINSLSFTEDKGGYISKLNYLMDSKGIKSLRDYVCVKGRIIRENGESYKPSNGEQSMLLLNNAIVDDTKNIFILDEPELSVGHKYINDIIVPRLIELSKLNKTVIISTHDANIAVRTLPLLSVYREYKGNDEYTTYIGNPFTNTLINPEDKNDICDWTEKSVSTLEGGEYAFIERGEIYGK
ncbi:MAG: hypothetical protein PHH04_07145 [Thomasclavelia sp.]|nr:hypothetical protein [Thomasclavelia sp.]